MENNTAMIYDGRLDVYSHNICFSRLKPRIFQALKNFQRPLVSFTSTYRPGKGYISTPNKIYAASTLDRREIRLHIHQKDEVLAFLEDEGISLNRLDIVEHTPKCGVKVAFNFDPNFEPFPHQVPIIKYFVEPGHSKVTELRTGGGKTACAMAAVSQIGERVTIVVGGKYVDKWVEDITEGLKLKKNEVMVVRGSKALESVINLGKAGELDKVKAFIITSTTLYNFFKDYERLENTYSCTPIELYEILGVGVRILDEAHENLHLNYKMDLYGQVKKSLYLSATLVSDDKFITKILEIAYPSRLRMSGHTGEEYIDVCAVNYLMADIDNFKYEGRNKMYSHIKFEESILKDNNRREAYADMIGQIVEDKFMATYKKHMKMIIFASTIEMCTYLTDYLQPIFNGLKVRRYVGEDEYEVLMTSDIVITTLKSAGTAVDIPDLEVGLLTTALGSKQQNIQALGRLRRIKRYKDLFPRYYYLVATNIAKHVSYHERKKESFKGRCRNHKTVNSNFVI